MKYVVSPVGTSVLTNGSGSLAPVILRNANKTQLSGEDAAIIRDWTLKRKDQLQASTLDQAAALSAELSGLLAIYANAPDDAAKAQDFHCLVATDTVLGKTCAELVCEKLRQIGFKCVATLEPKELRTDNLLSFHSGIDELVREFTHDLPAFRAKGYEILFNLTGGFKSVQGYLTVLGMIYADKLTYIFENREELLVIPRLPLSLDQSVLDIVKTHLDVFRSAKVLGQICAAQVEKLPESFFHCLDGMAMLSTWGNIAVAKAFEAIYQSDLLAPPTDRIVLSPRFLDIARKLTPEKVRQINETFDDLWRCLETGKALSSSKLKQLQGNPVPGATHEIYVNGGWRVFGTLVENTFTALAAQEHL